MPKRFPHLSGPIVNTKSKAAKKVQRGGLRPGSGRPRSGKFTRCFFVTDSEWKRLNAVFLVIQKERQASRTYEGKK